MTNMKKALMLLFLLVSACGAEQVTPMSEAAVEYPVDINSDNSTPTSTAVSSPTVTSTSAPTNYTISLDNLLNPQAGGINSVLTVPWLAGPHNINVCAPDADSLSGTFLQGPNNSLQPTNLLVQNGDLLCNIYEGANPFALQQNGEVNLMSPDGSVFLTIKFDYREPANPGGGGEGGEGGEDPGPGGGECTGFDCGGGFED